MLADIRHYYGEVTLPSISGTSAKAGIPTPEEIREVYEKEIAYKERQLAELAAEYLSGDDMLTIDRGVLTERPDPPSQERLQQEQQAVNARELYQAIAGQVLSTELRINGEPALNAVQRYFKRVERSVAGIVDQLRMSGQRQEFEADVHNWTFDDYAANRDRVGIKTNAGMWQ